MHKKEFWILTNKCGNKLKHETEAERVMTLSLVFVSKLIFMFNSKNPKSFLCMCWRRMSCSRSRRHLPRLQQGFRLSSSWKTSIQTFTSEYSGFSTRMVYGLPYFKIPRRSNWWRILSMGIGDIWYSSWGTSDMPNVPSPSTSITLFADDAKCYRVVRNAEDCLSLQHDLS